MEYNFNWSAVSGGAPYITFSSLGIAFNSVAIEKLGTPVQILIGFDEEHCAIGIKAFNNEVGVKPYEFASRVKNGWIRIGCKDFIKYLQSISPLDFTVSKKYVAQFDSNSKILSVKLLDDILDK
ncbi:MAG: hypothetical protein GX451_04180 [Acholeplasmataceae bacterium]|nr:hypothetical protein [Acholeplasmataceae bacterium]